MENNRNEMNSLSNQMIELFITDVLSKNKIDSNEAKENISKEQREKLKLTVGQLQEQVEDFLQSRNTVKTVAENDQSRQQPESPLREKILKKRQTKNAD